MVRTWITPASCLLGSLLFGCEPVRRPGGAFDAGPLFQIGTPTLRHRFVVKNTTGRRVKIEQKIASCTCTSADLDRMELGPGESTGLTLAVEIRDVPRAWDLSCRLVTDHPDVNLKMWDYRLTFHTYARALFDPDVVAFGEVNFSASSAVPADRQAVLEVYEPVGKIADRPSRWGIPPLLRVDVGHDVTTELIDGDRVRRRRYKLTVGLNPDELRTPGAQSAALSSTTERGGIANLIVTWSLRSPFRADPSEVHFGLIPRDTHPERSITVSSEDGRPFRIFGVDDTAREEPITVLPDPMERDLALSKHTLTLRYEGSEKIDSMARTGRVRLKTDNPSCPAIVIPWSVLLR